MCTYLGFLTHMTCLLIRIRGGKMKYIPTYIHAYVHALTHAHTERNMHVNARASVQSLTYAHKTITHARIRTHMHTYPGTCTHMHM